MPTPYLPTFHDMSSQVFLESESRFSITIGVLTKGLVKKCTNMVMIWCLESFQIGTGRKTFGRTFMKSLLELDGDWVITECSLQSDCWQVVTEHVWSPSQVCAISLTANPA